VINNVLLTCILGIVLIGTLYPLVTEAFGEKVSVGPPYFNPVGAIFAIPMLIVLAVGPLLRWRRDSFGRVRKELVIPAVLTIGTIAGVALASGIALLPLLAIGLAIGLGVASLLPLRGRNLKRTPLPVWGMVLAHFGVAVALFGMGSESAFSVERLVAARIGETVQVGPWQVKLAAVDPVAGPNWTALEAKMLVSYDGAAASEIHPQQRSFWTPPQQTSESALLTRWNGQLYAVLGEEAEDGRWQLRVWWKPFVPLIWLGGILIGLGGVLALIGRVASDLRRYVARGKIAYRRSRQGR
jgi:cytochrome c-type biogenesis protein CcmF